MQNSQSHLAYLALERAIVTLALAPGALVTEKQLIDLAGHGRTPVREAIQKLAWHGLIVVKPRVGLQIADIRSEDHANVMEVRRELEPIAAALVASHADENQRQQLLVCARQMQECSLSGDLGLFFAADKAFDEIVEDACPNRFITAALAPVQTHSRRLWSSKLRPKSIERSIALHIDAIRAIHDADPEQARQATETLIDYLAA